MKNEAVFLNQTESSNKFWKYKINGNDVHIEWARVGLTGQSQDKSFGSYPALERFLQGKIDEKIGKGYKEVDQEHMKDEVKTAEELGAQNKISEIYWVSRTDNKLTKLPEYDPTEFVMVKIMNSWSKDERIILLSKNSSGYIQDYNPKTGKFSGFSSRSDHFVEAVRNYIKRLYGKIKEVITIKYGSLGVRKLDLGMGDDDNVIESVQAKEIVSQVNEAGVSSQAVVMFASMGNRLLDL